MAGRQSNYSVLPGNMACGLVMTSWLATSSQAFAQGEVVRIEEHWELAITEADSQTNAPQIMMHFSPFGEGADWHFELDINHASLPSYAPGGFQVRAMQGNRVMSDVRLLDNNRLASQSELLTWVQIAQKQPSGWALRLAMATRPLGVDLAVRKRWLVLHRAICL